MSAPPPGRHRVGQPFTPVYRRVWDGPARDAAESLERSNPGWLVLYSLGGRTFYAIAAWPTPQPLIVDAPTPEELQEQMNEAQTTLLLQTTTPVPGPGGAAPTGHPRLPGTHRATQPVGNPPYPANPQTEPTPHHPTTRLPLPPPTP